MSENNLLERILGRFLGSNADRTFPLVEATKLLKQLKQERPDLYSILHTAKEQLDSDSRRPNLIYPISEVEHPENYIILEGKTDYPDLLIAKEKTHFSKDWYQAHEVLHREDSVMLTPKQFIDFVNLLDSNKVYDGNEDKLSGQKTKKLLDEITKQIEPWRSEWLDAKFRKTDGIWHIDYNHRTVDGELTPQTSEPLEQCLMKDCYADVFGSANRQGLPTKKGSDFYYWHPRNDTVAWFGAYSGRVGLYCGRFPQVSDSGLGVRPAKQRV